MKKPEELVTEIERSIFGKALVVSFVAHVILIAVTSVSLFKDWGEYGVHSPSYINGVRSAKLKAEEEARRKAAAEAKAAEEAARAEQMKAAASSNRTAKASNVVSTPAAAERAEKDAKAKSVEPPEIKPLPPKKDFEYGEDLSI